MRRPKGERGLVYSLTFDEESGPPGETWDFSLVRIGGKRRRDPLRFSIATDCEIWCESIMKDAYRRIDRRVGEATIIPTKEVVSLFADVPTKELNNV